jgi:hypothetical protein
MSLLNVWTSPARAIVSVDTRSSTADRKQFGEASKMALIPHTGVVVAVNGLVLALSSLFQWLSNNDQDDTSIDGIPGWLPSQLNAPAVKQAVAEEGLLVAVVGFSKTTNGFRGFRIAQVDGDFAAKEIRPYFLCPGDRWTPATLPVPDNRESCLTIARRQVEWARRHRPGEPIGGRLLIAELTRKESRIYDAGQID